MLSPPAWWDSIPCRYDSAKAAKSSRRSGAIRAAASSRKEVSDARAFVEPLRQIHRLATVDGDRRGSLAL
jgi:hypothetical protein